MADEVRVNGLQTSWGDIVLKVGGERFTGFTAIKFGDKRDRVKAYGIGKAQGPRGRSRGRYEPDPVVLTGWKASVQALREKLAALSPSGTSYGDVEFEILVQYIPTGSEAPQTVEIERCVWAENSADDEEGPDPLKEDITLDCMLIRRNGTVLFDDSTGEVG